MSGGLLEKAKNQDSESAADDVEAAVEDMGEAVDGGLLGRASAEGSISSSSGGGPFDGIDPSMMKPLLIMTIFFITVGLLIAIIRIKAEILERKKII